MSISAVVQAKPALPASLWVHRKDNDLSLRTVRQQARGSGNENKRERKRDRGSEELLGSIYSLISSCAWRCRAAVEEEAHTLFFQIFSPPILFPHCKNWGGCRVLEIKLPKYNYINWMKNVVKICHHCKSINIFSCSCMQINCSVLCTAFQIYFI